jgi:signal transduction histidine kinase
MQWFPLYYTRSIPITSAMVIHFSMERNLASLMLSVSLLWFMAGTFAIAKKLHRTVRSEILQRYESEILSERVAKKAEEVHQIMMSRSKFLAAASHDLRQPLHALLLFVDLLKDTTSEQERNALHQRIDFSLSAMKKLFDSLLDVSRLDAGAVVSKLKHFDVGVLLTNLVNEFKPETEMKGLKLRSRIVDSIVLSDPVLLERIIRNLISNAIRYTDTGSILVSCRSRGDKILIQVWDTGIGIPEESMDDVFVEFQQLNNGHRNHAEGLGLGLSVVKRLCELLNHALEH